MKTRVAEVTELDRGISKRQTFLTPLKRNNIIREIRKHVVAKCIISFTLFVSPRRNASRWSNRTRLYIRVQNQRGVKTLSFLSTKSRRTPHHPRAGRRRKMCDVGIVRCTCTHAWDRYVPRVPQGTKESHIHGIYGGIALLEHLRTTMTMHRDAMLRARRAIRVMHQNAPNDFLSLFLPLSQFLRIVTQRRPVCCILIAQSDRFYWKFRERRIVCYTSGEILWMWNFEIRMREKLPKCSQRPILRHKQQEAYFITCNFL